MNWTDELNAAWPEKWRPASIKGLFPMIGLWYRAHGLTCRVYRAGGSWWWEVSSSGVPYWKQGDEYRDSGEAASAGSAVDALMSAVREYAARLMDLAS
jgi:hypothetical protein